MNERYVKISESIHKGATARVRLDNHVSEPFAIGRGGRQGGSNITKVIYCSDRGIIKKTDLDKGINIDAERLQNLIFADYVALVTKTTKEMQEHLNKLNTESKKCGLKIHKGKKKFMTNFETDKGMKIENKKLEKMESYNYLGQITTTKRKSEDEIKERSRKSWNCFGKNKEIFMNKNLPLSLKRQAFNQCIIPTTAYGCETWAINKQKKYKNKINAKSNEKENITDKTKRQKPTP